MVRVLQAQGLYLPFFHDFFPFLFISFYFLSLLFSLLNSFSLSLSLSFCSCSCSFSFSFSFSYFSADARPSFLSSWMIPKDITAGKEVENSDQLKVYCVIECDQNEIVVDASVNDPINPVWKHRAHLSPFYPFLWSFILIFFKKKKIIFFLTVPFTYTFIFIFIFTFAFAFAFPSLCLFSS